MSDTLKTKYETLPNADGSPSDEAIGEAEYLPTYTYKTVEDYKPTDYTESVDTNAIMSKLTDLEENGAPTWTSNYQDTIDNLLNQIVNRENFSYDFNVDPLYQQYADKYTQQGKQAMMNTIGTQNAMTGGYGNTYSQMAGQQQYNSYLSNLNDEISTLYKLAADRYDQETTDLTNKWKDVNTQNEYDYSKYRDAMSDYDTDRNYYYNKWLAGINQNNTLTELYQKYHQLDPNYATKRVVSSVSYNVDQHTKDLATIASDISGKVNSSSSASAIAAAADAAAAARGITLVNKNAAGNNGDYNTITGMLASAKDDDK